MAEQLLDADGPTQVGLKIRPTWETSQWNTWV